MIYIEGKAGISAKVLADSINKAGDRLLSYELVYPRMIHAELLTHGMLVRNAASSRAIPFAKMQEQLTARPVRFGEKNAGMQDKGVDHDAPVFVHRYMVEAFRHWIVNNIPEASHNTYWCEEADGYYTSAENWWKFAGFLSSGCAQMFFEAEYHKQVYNRLTEPHQMMKTVLSATEMDNFFWLRDDDAADPSLEELAKVMREAKAQSTPQLLMPGEWHLPYVEMQRTSSGEPCYIIDFPADAGDPVIVTTEQAIKVSAARCAAVSFRNEDYGLEKCLEVYDRLIGDERKHASAFQHQATPMKEKKFNLGTHMKRSDYVNIPSQPDSWEPGISHADRDGNLWSAQFKGFVMNRKLIPGENYTKQ